MTKRWWASIALAVAMATGVSACGSGEQSAGQEPSASSSGQSSGSPSVSASPGKGTPKPDLEGIPKVVATVNGKKIPRDEFVQAYKAQFQRASRQQQMLGKPVDQDKLKQQVAKNLVSSELLTQEASNRGLAAPDKQVKQKLQDLAKQNRMSSVDKLFAALKKQGLDKQSVREDVRTQIKIDKLLKQETGKIQPSEKELRKLYNQAVKSQQQSQQNKKQQAPSFKQVRPQLVEQFKQRKRAQAAQSLLKDLRKKADVTNNL